MTSGTFVANHLVYTPTTCGGGSDVGWKYTKTWTGGDRLVGEPPWQPHNYSATILALSMTKIAWKKGASSGDGTVFSCFAGHTAPVSPWTANDDILLISKLNTKIKGADFNLAVFLGEGGQTLSMIADIAKRVRQSIKLAKQGNLSGAAQSISGLKPSTPKGKGMSRVAPPPPAVFGLYRGDPRMATDVSEWVDYAVRRSRKRRSGGTWNSPLPSGNAISRQAANDYLVYWFGLYPLLGDVASAFELLTRQLGTPGDSVQRITTSRERRAAGLTDWPNATYNVGTSYCTAKGRIIAYVTENPLSWTALLGLNDPELVLWERTPFSFVVDWWIPIGTYLEARALARRLKGTFCTSKFVDRRWEGVFSGFSKTYGYTITGGERSYRKDITLSRTVSTTLSVPLPTWKPLWNENSGWHHATLSVALLTQMFTR